MVERNKDVCPLACRWLSQGVADMAPIATSRAQAMAGIFHPFVSLCFHCMFIPGHLASRLKKNMGDRFSALRLLLQSQH